MRVHTQGVCLGSCADIRSLMCAATLAFRGGAISRYSMPCESSACQRRTGAGDPSVRHRSPTGPHWDQTPTSRRSLEAQATGSFFWKTQLGRRARSPPAAPHRVQILGCYQKRTGRRKIAIMVATMILTNDGTPVFQIGRVSGNHSCLKAAARLSTATAGRVIAVFAYAVRGESLGRAQLDLDLAPRASRALCLGGNPRIILFLRNSMPILAQIGPARSSNSLREGAPPVKLPSFSAHRRPVELLWRSAAILERSKGRWNKRVSASRTIA